MLALMHYIHEHVQGTMHVKQQPCHRNLKPYRNDRAKKDPKNGWTEGLKQG